MQYKKKTIKMNVLIYLFDKLYLYYFGLSAILLYTLSAQDFMWSFTAFLLWNVEITLNKNACALVWSLNLFCTWIYI